MAEGAESPNSRLTPELDRMGRGVWRGTGGSNEKGDGVKEHPGYENICHFG